MSAIILDGKQLASSINRQLHHKIVQLQHQHIHPKLVVILVGQDPASEIYVKNKKQACEALGIICEIQRYEPQVTQIELQTNIQELNQNSEVNGILIQLPLPPHIHINQLIECIHPQKDIDGFHPYNLGLLALGCPKLRACTPMGIMQLLDAYQIDVQGKDVLIIGTSRIVGLPLGFELMNRHATVTSAHKMTQNLSNKVKTAEIIITATGHRNIIASQDLNPQHIIIDVGIHYLHGKVFGDIDFDKLSKQVKAITPVPGGVGPMTVCALIQNIILACQLQYDQCPPQSKSL